MFKSRELLGLRNNTEQHQKYPCECGHRCFHWEKDGQSGFTNYCFHIINVIMDHGPNHGSISFSMSVWLHVFVLL